MAEEKKPNSANEAQESYRIAKLIRQGSRELERQYNSKNTK